MNIRLFGTVALLCFAGIGYFLSTNSVAARATPDRLPRVHVGASSDDGKELYSLDVYEPWDEAGQQVVILACASIGASGLASLALTETTYVGLVSAATSARGEFYECTAHLNVATWSDVRRPEDVRLELVRNP